MAVTIGIQPTYSVHDPRSMRPAAKSARQHSIRGIQPAGTVAAEVLSSRIEYRVRSIECED
jgi:hypothetical protein